MSNNLKVFISSTFRDLDAERDYIVKILFPEIRERLEGVTLSEIDLRWGITEAQAKEGRVVDLCLRYLVESRPLFIGILGDRYGSCLNNSEVFLSMGIESRFPGIRQQIRDGRSITEMEIINGVLDNPDEMRAIFFIKDTDRPAPSETREDFEKLQALKEKVRKQVRYPVHIFTQLSDFDCLIDFFEKALLHENRHARFDVDNPTRNLRIDTTERLERYRSCRIHDTDILCKIGIQVEESASAVIVTGKAGSGKSTLLAHLTPLYSPVGRHFIYLYGNDFDWPLIPAHFADFFFKEATAELKSKGREFTDDRWLIRQVFLEKWCFVIDNIDAERHLSDNRVLQISKVIRRFVERAEKQLHWVLDYKVLYVATTGDPVITDLQSVSDIPVLEFPFEETFWPSDLINSYLQVYSKNLTEAQVQRLAHMPAGRNPKALELLMDFMKDNIRHEGLDTFIDRAERLDSLNGVIRFYLDNMFSTCRREHITRIVRLLGTYPSGLSRDDLKACCDLDNMTFSITMSYLEKFLECDYLGRLHFLNRNLRDITLSALELSEKDFAACARETFQYFRKEMDPCKLFTQEDFLLETDKQPWHWGKYWEAIIPRHIEMAVPVSRSNAIESMFGRGMSRSMDASRKLRYCGGYSYENTCRAYDVFRGNVAFGLAERQAALAWRKGMTEEARQTIEKSLQQDSDNFQRIRNPFAEDIIHVIESCLAAGRTHTQYLSSLVKNPPYANRVLFTTTFQAAWFRLISDGYPIQNEEIKKNTLFPRYAFRELCLLMNYKDEADYYTTQDAPIYVFPFPDPKYAIKSQEAAFKEYESGNYYGETDWRGDPHGEGCYLFHSPMDIYIGSFHHNKRHGKGTYYYANGSLYDGEWVKDGKQGSGRLYNAETGLIYEGEFKDGYYHGKGKLTYTNGTCYEGGFVKGRYHGNGVLRWPDGTWFTGTFKDGAREGLGITHWTNGAWTEGIWHGEQMDPATRKDHTE